MNRSLVLVAGILATLVLQPAAAEEIMVSPSQIENLGIRFALPTPAHEVTAIETTARVVVPPSGDAIISAPLPGLLAGLDVAIGEEVLRGQVLARLQSPEFVALQREFLDALNTNMLAQNEFERDQQLFDEGIISRRRLQETGTRARIAATGVNEHQQLLSIAGLPDSGIRALEADQKLVQELTIRAPFDGVILERMATAGERMDAMSPVYRLADLSTLWLEINVPQEARASVTPGMKVSVDSSPVPMLAEVTTIGRSIDRATQTTIVRATIDKTGHGLSPGQFVSARIVGTISTSNADALWKVPVAAVTRRDAHSYIFVKTESGFDVRQVEVFGSNAEHTTLAADIQADDRIVVVGVATLKALWAAQDETDS